LNNKYFILIQKNIIPLFKKWVWPLVRKLMIFLGVLLILGFVAIKVNWAPIENWAIDKLSRQEPEPPSNQKYLQLMQGKVSIEDTVTYKKEKYTIFKTNIKNSFQLVVSKFGYQTKSTKNKSFESVSKDISKNSKYKDLNFDFDEVQASETKSQISDWDIIKSNFSDGFGALEDMLTVSIMTRDGKPIIVKVVEDEPVVVQEVEFDPSHKVLRWGKYILRASEKYGVDPAIIAAMIEQESGGNPTVNSHAGAIGLMQLMPRTAQGLKVDPYDPEQNIEGGTKYLAIQLKRFGDLELALAAYNAGPGNVRNSRYLYISETQRYIKNVPALAMKYQGKFTATTVQ
jgi:hypothetical protein